MSEEWAWLIQYGCSRRNFYLVRSRKQACKCCSFAMHYIVTQPTTARHIHPFFRATPRRGQFALIAPRSSGELLQWAEAEMLDRQIAKYPPVAIKHVWWMQTNSEQSDSHCWPPVQTAKRQTPMILRYATSHFAHVSRTSSFAARERWVPI